MYTTCLHCHQQLGTNQALEHFPVARRVAFDAAKGRLWAVCPHCGRWNLAPLEDRWEAIEAAERLFRDTRIRVSTDNIGLAKLRDGTELVRIGEALRPEFAAWRYTNQIVRRRRTALAVGAVTTAGVGAASFGLVGALGVSGFGWWTYQAIDALRKRWHDRRVIHRVSTPDGPLVIRHGDLWRFEWIPGRAQQPSRLIFHRVDASAGDSPDVGPSFSTRKHRQPLLDLSGNAAASVGAVVLARLNRTAGSRQQIRDALQWLEVFGNPFLEVDAPPSTTLRVPEGARSLADPLAPFRAVEEEPAHAPPHVRLIPLRSTDAQPTRWAPYLRLAFEIAAHEEQERLYLASHLSLLEDAWKEAEAIARIADDLLLPEWIQRRIPG